MAVNSNFPRFKKTDLFVNEMLWLSYLNSIYSDSQFASQLNFAKTTLVLVFSLTKKKV